MGSDETTSYINSLDALFCIECTVPYTNEQDWQGTLYGSRIQPGKSTRYHTLAEEPVWYPIGEALSVLRSCRAYFKQFEFRLVLKLESSNGTSAEARVKIKC